MYKTAEEMSKIIEDYFNSCGPVYLKDSKGEVVLGKDNKPVQTDFEPPTITGLAMSLGFTSRQALLNYEAKEAFVDTVKKAKLKVEHFSEKKLYDPSIRPAGAIFALKNYGWRDDPKREGDEEKAPLVIKDSTVNIRNALNVEINEGNENP
jgi:hypothetical protein